MFAYFKAIFCELEQISDIKKELIVYIQLHLGCTVVSMDVWN